MGSSYKRSQDKDRKKKKKHRSRSRERDRSERHRHHHKHKKHKRAREELSPSISLSDLSDFEPADFNGSSLKKYTDETVHQPPAKMQKKSHSLEIVAKDIGKVSSNKESSLSIVETNKIRAKLGLKLLEVPGNSAQSKSDRVQTKVDESSDYKAGEEVHRPPENIRDKLQVDKLREKIAAQREKRRLTGKLKSVKTLGESDDEGGTKDWVVKSRKKEKERKEAEEKNKMLDMLDAQFGVGDLIDEEIVTKKRRGYSSNHLSGLRVQHDTERFMEGRTTILTLRDSNILEGEEDTLQNVDLIDIEKAEKNLKAKKSKTDDDLYDAPDVDEFGNILQKDMLSKYDEEISGEKKRSFRIGHRGIGAVVEDEERGGNESSSLVQRNQAKKLNKLRELTSLVTADNQLATEYLTTSEMSSSKFKKVKRKKKKRKMLTADDLQDWGTQRYNNVEEGEIEVRPEQQKIKSLRELMEEDEDDSHKRRRPDEDLDMEESDDHDDSIELQEALARSRRAKLLSNRVSNIVPKNHGDPVVALKTTDEADDNMTLNLTDEFCRSLGDIPTYGLSGNRADEDAVIADLAQSPQRNTIAEYGLDASGAWEEVVDVEETKVEIANDKFTPILEEEPDTTQGVCNALKLAVKKGYLEKGNAAKNANATLQHLKAVHYSIEDKTMDDDRRSRNNDRYMGPTMDFKEKDLYRPDVILEYVDDEGRKLNSKEAFRYLSHKFHGKGSGKNKLEKRMKKWNEELLLKSMSSSDTPLQTLEKQKEKQKQTGAAYLVLSGSKPQELLQVKK